MHRGGVDHICRISRLKLRWYSELGTRWVTWFVRHQKSIQRFDNVFGLIRHSRRQTPVPNGAVLLSPDRRSYCTSFGRIIRKVCRRVESSKSKTRTKRGPSASAETSTRPHREYNVSQPPRIGPAKCKCDRKSIFEINIIFKIFKMPLFINTIVCAVKYDPRNIGSDSFDQLTSPRHWYRYYYCYFKVGTVEITRKRKNLAHRIFCKWPMRKTPTNKRNENMFRIPVKDPLLEPFLTNFWKIFFYWITSYQVPTEKK